MFKDVGDKIKAWATFNSLIGMMIFTIYLLIVLLRLIEGDGSVGQLLISLVGILVSWVSGFLLYGFGEMVESSMKTAKNTEEMLKLIQGGNTMSTAASAPQVTYAPPTVVPQTAPVQQAQGFVSTMPGQQ